MSTVYEDAVHTLREVGERLVHEVPSSIPSNLSLPDLNLSDLNLSRLIPTNLHPSALVPSGAGWSDDLADRVSDGGRLFRRHPLLVAGGVLAVLAGVVWLVRRRSGKQSRDEVVAGDRRTADAA